MLFLIVSFTKRQGTNVQVKINGEIIAIYNLEEDGVYHLNDGTNILYINDKTVWIETAECPDKLCIKQGKISSVGESIICLPYKLTITIIGE